MAQQDRFTKLKPWSKDRKDLCVVIETPKGSRNKFAMAIRLTCWC